MTDYIKRSDIADRIDYYESHSVGAEHYAYEVCQKEIRDVQSADVSEVRHAKWTHVLCFDDLSCVAFCSACATEQKTQSATALQAFNRYCRWCGAQMDLGVDYYGRTN